MTDIRVVLDTNVIISAIFWKGTPYRVMREGLSGNLTILTSPAMLEEVSERLQGKFKMPAEKVRTLQDIMLVYSRLVEPKISLKVVEADEKDNKVVECAVEGKADFIVTGDNHLLTLRKYKGIGIISPAKLLELL